MRKLLLVVGFGVIGVLLVIVSTTPIIAQDDKDKEYVGARECAGCHRDLARSHEETPHGLALFAAKDDEFVVADFSSGEDERTITLPGADEAAAFSLDDVAFVIGQGHYAQRFVFEVGRDEYAVLPVEWNAVSGEWQPYGPVENWPEDPAYDFGFSCAGCHVTGLDARRGRWEDEGVQCEACHGPGSIHADEADGAGDRPSDRELVTIRGAIVRSPDAQICGQCHVRGQEPNDNHPYPVDYLPGHDLLDENVYTVVATDDTDHWWKSGHAKLGNMQFNEWLTSGHASALNTMQSSSSAKDECLQCHSSDYRWTAGLIQAVDDGDRAGDPLDPVTLETAQFGVTCNECHNPHAEDENANFYLRAEPYNLCVECHTNTTVTDSLHHPVQQMFEGTTLVSAVAGIQSEHYQAEEGPNCLTCHVSQVPIGEGSRATHALVPVLPGDTEDGQLSVCATCHEDLNTTDLEFLVNDMQGSIRDRLSLGYSRLGSIEVPAEDSPQRENYDNVQMALSFVQNDGSLGMHNYDYASALLDYAEQTLSELSVPGAQVETTADMPFPTATPDGPVPVSRQALEAESSGPRPVVYLVLGIAVFLILISAGAFFYKPKSKREEVES